MKIDQKIASKAETLCREVNNIYAGAPHHMLDFSWPSISSLEDICLSIKFKENLEPIEKEVINNIAAYIGVIASDCWSYFPDKVEISLIETDGDISIIAKGGRFLEEKAFHTIDISKDLRQILRKPEDPFPFYGKFEKSLNTYDNIITLYALGVMCGNSPYGKGPWTEVEVEKFSPYLQAAANFLSITACKFYQRTFPHESIGQQQVIYYNYLIVPPMDIGESNPCVHSSAQLFKVIQKFEFEEQEIENLCSNLSCNPDRQISLTAFIIGSAYSKEKATGRLINYAEANRDWIFRTRDTIKEFKKILELDYDWVELAANGEREKAKKLIEIEKSLNLIPLFWLPTELTLELNNPELFSCISETKTSETLGLLSQMTDKTGALAVFEGFLELSNGNQKRTEELLSYLSTDNALGENVYLLLELMAQLALFKGDFNRAIEILEQANKEQINDKIHRVNILSNLSWALIRVGKDQRALEIINDSLELDRNNSTLKLNRITALSNLKKTEEAKHELSTLLRTNPNDRRVISLL